MPGLAAFRVVSGVWVVLVAVAVSWFPACAAGAETPTRLAVIADYGTNNQAESDVADLVKGWSPDLILTVGDNNHNGAGYGDGDPHLIDLNIGQYFHEYIGNYQGAYGAGSPANRFFPVLGNHDYSSTYLYKTHTDYFTLPPGQGNERYYDFVQGPVHFFMLNSETHEPDGISKTSTQAQWLQAAMAASTSAFNFVFLHDPPYTSSDRHPSNTTVQWPFKTWGADAVFAGHAHVYERLLEDGLTYFVAGVAGETLAGFVNPPIAGSQVRYGSDYGAMWVEADSAAATFKYYTRTGALVDTFSLPVTINEWKATAGGSYGVPLNWVRNHVPSGADAVANFLKAPTGAVTVDAPATLGTLNFQSAGAYTLAGPAAVTMQATAGNASLRAQGSDHTVSAPLVAASDTDITVADSSLTLSGSLDNAAGRTLSKEGDGALIIEGPQTHGAGAVFNAAAGATRFGRDAGENGAFLSVNVTGGALTFDAPQHLAALNVSAGTAGLTKGGAKVLVTGDLGVDAAAGTLDLADNDLIVDYPADGASPLDTVRGLIASGYAGRAWNGKGIVSSEAAADALLYGLGYAQNGTLYVKVQTFSGEPVDDSTVLVKYTYLGDLNLDGKVDDNDVTFLVLSYDRGLTTSHTWQQGDIAGYDGKVDDNDVAPLVLNYRLGIGAPLGTRAEAVPEPATLALMALGALGVAACRRR